MALPGCNLQHEAYVECVGVDTDFNCTVEHKKGGSAIEACWDVTVACVNGTKTKASTCHTVQPKSKSTKFMPVKDFPGADKCDKAQTVQVENLKLNIK